MPIEFPKLNRPPYLVLRMTAPGKALFADLALVKAKRPGQNLVKESVILSIRQEPSSTALDSEQRSGWETDCRDAAGKKFCLQLTGTDAKKTIHFMQGDIPVKAGTEYQLSVRFKGRKDTLFGAYLETNAPWQTNASPMVKCNGKWQELKWKFRIYGFPEASLSGLSPERCGEVVFCEPEITAEEQRLKTIILRRRKGNGNPGAGKIPETKSSYGKVLELTCVTKNASARQSGITVKGGQYYQLRYEARGGSDRTHRDAQGQSGSA
ncbi:MAG: carbohydrate binding domain-containing protein [Victivallales bacterium]